MSFENDLKGFCDQMICFCFSYIVLNIMYLCLVQQVTNRTLEKKNIADTILIHKLNSNKLCFIYNFIYKLTQTN